MMGQLEPLVHSVITTEPGSTEYLKHCCHLPWAVGKRIWESVQSLLNLLLIFHWPKQVFWSYLHSNVRKKVQSNDGPKRGDKDKTLKTTREKKTHHV